MELKDRGTFGVHGVIQVCRCITMLGTHQVRSGVLAGKFSGEQGRIYCLLVGDRVLLTQSLKSVEWVILTLFGKKSVINNTLKFHDSISQLITLGLTILL